MTTGTALSGMTAIRDFCRSINMQSSEVTIVQLIKEEDFPAKKLGGVWESDQDLIIQWRKRRLAVVTPEPEEPPKPELEKKPAAPAAATDKGKGNGKGKK
jgi:hypothetical protein